MTDGASKPEELMLVYSAGRPFQIRRLEPEELNRAFISFYEQALTPGAIDIAPLIVAAGAFFDGHKGSPTAADDYFTNFTALWSFIDSQMPWHKALEVWRLALEPVRHWEELNGARLHKGVPYYFAAVSAIKNGDLDTGYLYAHRALEEDVKTHGSRTPSTPSYALVVMDASVEAQAFRGWVIAKSDYLEGCLGSLRLNGKSTLSLQQLRTRFLLNPELRDEAFLFSYCIARLLRLRPLRPIAQYGPFGGQHAANVLFDLTTVIESLFRRIVTPTGKGMFKALVAAVSARIGAQLSDDRLNELNRRFEHDFSGTMRVLLDGRLVIDKAHLVAGSGSALAITYGCRNRGAHHVSGAEVFGERFDELTSAVLQALFTAIEHLREPSTGGGA